MNPQFWDDRYKQEGFAYGLEPNDFLSASIAKLRDELSVKQKPINVLAIGEGEGRNALFLARQGFHVFAMDYSAIGMQKLREESIKQHLDHLIHTEVADLNDYDFKKSLPEGADGWDLIISIFAHVPTPLEVKVMEGVRSSLSSTGYLLLTGYHPTNIGRGTGGPQVADMCMTKEKLQNHFPVPAWRFVQLDHIEKPVNEGAFHTGVASVIECIVARSS